MQLLALMENPHVREIYAIAGRRRGKTFAFAVGSVKYGTEHPKSQGPAWKDSERKPPTRIGIVGPDYERGKRIYDEIKQQFPEILLRKDDNAMELILRSGAFIKVYSGENLDSMRGEGFDIVVLDEAAFINETLVEQVVYPTLLDRRGRLWACSTPKFGRQNWFCRRYLEAVEAAEKGEPIPGVATWKSRSDENPRIDPADLEREKSRRDPLTIREEYDAEILDTASNWLDPTKLILIDPKDIPSNTFNSIIIDSAWGKPRAGSVDKHTKRRKDATVIAVIGQDQLGNSYLIEGMWSQTMQPQEAYEFIDSMIRKHNVKRLGKEVIADDPFFQNWNHYCKLHAGVPNVGQVPFHRGANWKIDGIRYWSGQILYKGKMFIAKGCALWPHLVSEMELYNEADAVSDKCHDDCLSVCADILQPGIYIGQREAEARRSTVKDLYHLADAWAAVGRDAIQPPRRSKYSII